MKETNKIIDYHWEESDLIVTYEDGNKKRYTNTKLIDVDLGGKKMNIDEPLILTVETKIND